MPSSGCSALHEVNPNEKKNCLNWTPSYGWKGPMNKAYPSVLPSESFLGIDSLVFSMVLGAHVLLCVTEPYFFGKILFAQKWPNIVKNGPKTGFFNHFEKCYHWFLQKMSLNKSWYYLSSSTNPITGESLVLEL